MSEELILVVEDSEHVAGTIADVVQLMGFRSRIASSGKEALAALAEFTPGGDAADEPKLVILDWILPDLDGIEILRRIRSGPFASLPVILLTAKGELTSRLEGLEAGADDYIAKPFNMKELQARILAVLRRTS
jgi:DNA-binding response OmpR family regulator